MKKKRTNDFLEYVLVIIFAITSTIVSTIVLFSQYIRRPPDTIFVGIAHYWEDLYYYLDQFYQGAHGAWLTTNNFSIEKFPPTTIYFINILLGKLGGLFGLESFTTYNLAIIFSKFLFIIVSYYVIKKIVPNSASYRLIILCIFLFSTSFPIVNLNAHGSFSISNLTLFRAENTVSSRFGNVPGSLIRNILFLLALVLSSKLIKNVERNFELYKTKTIQRLFGTRTLMLLVVIVGLLMILSLSDAAKIVVLSLVVGIYLLFHLPKNKKASYLFIWSILGVCILLPPSLLMLNAYNAIKGNPAYSYAIAWDMEQQQIVISNLLKNPIEIILSFGTLGIAFISGIYFAWKKEKTNLESLGYIFACIGIIGFFLPTHLVTPIPGFRLIFSSSYVFVAMIAFQALIQVKKKAGTMAFVAVVLIYFLPNVITITNTTIQNSKPLKEPYYHLAYLPKTIYDSLLFLRAQKPDDAIVLGNPVTSLDMLIPGFTGKRTYSGHFLMTINAKQKDKNVTDFLYKWTDQDLAKKFLTENNIKYVFWTKYSGDVNQIKRDYKFLRIIFENPDVSVLTYD